jgi:hypothetical protein
MAAATAAVLVLALVIMLVLVGASPACLLWHSGR